MSEKADAFMRTFRSNEETDRMLADLTLDVDAGVPEKRRRSIAIRSAIRTAWEARSRPPSARKRR